MVLQLPENLFQRHSAVPPITFNGKLLSYDAQWHPLIVEGNRIRRLDDLAGEPSKRVPERAFTPEELDYNNHSGRCAHRQQIGRRAMACVEGGDYGNLFSLLNPVMTPPLRRAISTGNPNSIKEHIARATDYKSL